MGLRHLLFAGGMLLACGNAIARDAVSSTGTPARFQLQGQLQAEAPAKSNARFSVRASLLSSAPRPDAQARFLLSARLEHAHVAKGVCAAPGSIFANGFEAP